MDQLLRVKKIVIEGSETTSKIQSVEALRGRRIFLIDPSIEKAHLQSANIGYDIRSFSIHYPQTISLVVRRIFPEMYLQVSGGVLLLSVEGKVLAKERTPTRSDIPIAQYYESIPYLEYEAGDMLFRKDILDAMYFKAGLERWKEKVNSIDIKGYDMLRLTTKEHEFLFSAERDRKIQAYQLEKALAEFGLNSMTYAMLDFRFDKPVVTFQK